MRLTLQSERLGPLPIVNHFLSRLGLEELLDSFVPTIDRRCRLPYAKGIGVLVRSILVEREPIYRQQETVSTFAHEAFGLDEDLVRHIGDDAIGRSLDRLFDADCPGGALCGGDGVCYPAQPCDVDAHCPSGWICGGPGYSYF